MECHLPATKVVIFGRWQVTLFQPKQDSLLLVFSLLFSVYYFDASFRGFFRRVLKRARLATSPQHTVSFEIVIKGSILSCFRLFVLDLEVNVLYFRKKSNEMLLPFVEWLMSSITIGIFFFNLNRMKSTAKYEYALHIRRKI